jgi:HupF/HypC family
MEVCVTCRDEALPMVVLELDPARELALCRGEDGSTSTVEVGLLEGVFPGELLLVHAGAALARAGSRGEGRP